MRIYIVIILVLTLQFFYSCQKKKIEIDFRQKECEKLSINSPLYTWVKDPSCGAGGDSAVIKIVFKHPEQKKCIEKILPDPVFYNTENKEISNVSYSKTIKKDDSGVSVYHDSASFILKTKFFTTAEAYSLSHIHLRFKTESNFGDKSKETKIRINGRCATVHKTDYTVKDTIAVNSNLVNITFYDDASQDGDVISVYLNGTWVLENFKLTNAGNNFSFYVNKGMNDLVVFAVNQGEVGPNTCAVTVNGGKRTDLNQGLLKGEAIAIKFD